MVDKKSALQICLKILLYIALLVLFVNFFFQDQMSAFIAARTTITTRNEAVDSMEYPTVTFCFNPGAKQSVVNSFGVTEQLYNSNWQNWHSVQPNLTMIDTYDAITYSLNQDFEFYNFQQNNLSYINKINLGSQFISECHRKDFVKPFNLKPIRTSQSGTCYKLSPEFQAKIAPIRFCFRISLKPGLIFVSPTGVRCHPNHPSRNTVQA